MNDFVAACAAVLVKRMREDSWPLVRDALAAFLVDHEPGSESRAKEVRQELDRARSDLLEARERGDEGTAADVEAELRMRLRRVLHSRPRAGAPLRHLISQLPPDTPQSGTREEAGLQATQKPLRRRRKEIVAVLLFSGGPIFESSIPLSVFGIDRQDAGVPRYRLLVTAGEQGPLRTTGGLELFAPHGLEALSRAGTVVVPAWRSLTSLPSAEALDALRRAHEEGARIVGLGTGVFVLAAAGLLDGRPATTHWMYAPSLAKRYPAVHVDPRELFVDDGDILTSAGTAAGIDLCLHIVRTDHGSEVAGALARRLVVPARRTSGQEHYLDRTLPDEIGTDPLADVVAWALEHLHEQFDVETLAARAYMSRRTFDRRFRELTGSAPLQWLTTQRVLQAQRLLEVSEYSVEEIAERCGFRSPAALRGHFRRQLGSFPAAYREAYRAPRASGGGTLHTSPGPSPAPDDDEWPAPPPIPPAAPLRARRAAGPTADQRTDQAAERGAGT
ncbi:helix-turn-helix domain-containing protein [Streptomyces sp. NPDC001928]|uniref:helix-turn-helix domain-containing protein n=1 Tax=Streptomyces sp. NPDC001928 TaxID=3154404 RepID=UPI00332EDB84